MKQIFILIFTVVFNLFAAPASGGSRLHGLSEDSPVFFGDPFIMLYEGVYYAYGTSGADGIRVYTSEDLLTWEIPERNLALS
ncbi:MAG: hypothetical protein LBL04_06390, partial [Bacteroidales bacterium]|nr:hypothetical protein [Bacteroidales bacterium]